MWPKLPRYRQVLGIVISGLGIAALPQIAVAQDMQDPRLAQRALAAFGFVAIPNETAATLDFQAASGDNFDFRTAQLGGGFRPRPGDWLYLEGFLGWQSYDPELLQDNQSVSRSGQIAPQDTRWSSRAATGAVGYNFDLTPEFTLRPALHLAIGEFSSDETLTPDLNLNPGIEPLGTGDFSTGGYGLSFGLEYKYRSKPREIDIRARHTWMRITPLEQRDLLHEADAIATSVYGRLRHPLGDLQAFKRPVRAVWEISASAYPGDQGQSLDTPWLAKVGAGFELETSALPIAYLDRVRLVASYAFGESYNGYSIGLGVSFRRQR
ncbi:MAG: hypothetical protein AAGF94_11940 [Pseudomonadota bacterium]